MKKGLRIFLYIIGGLFALGIIGNLIDDGKGSASSVSVASLTQAQRDSISRDSIQTVKRLTVSASNLVEMYKQNEVKADNQLKGQQFYVSGRIEAIGKDMMGDAYVTLKTGDDIRSVQCFINDNAVVAELNKGDKILVKGTCNGLMMNVLMKDCEVVSE